MGALWQQKEEHRTRAEFGPEGQQLAVKALGGTRLHVVCRGNATSTRGPVVLLEAGLPCCSYSWRRVLPLLPPHLLVCAYDRAGYCHSQPATHAPADAATAARAAAEILQSQLGGQAELEARGVLLVGWSYGAYVAALAASDQQALRGLVRGLVLVDPSPPNASRAAEFETLRQTGERAFAVLARVREAGVCLAAGRAGLLPQNAGWPPSHGVPADMAARMKAALCWRGWAEAARAELAAWHRSEAQLEAALASGPLPANPVLLLLAAQQPVPGPADRAAHMRWSQLTAASRARVLPVTSDHDIPYHVPEVVVRAVELAVHYIGRPEAVVVESNL